MARVAVQELECRGGLLFDLEDEALPPLEVVPSAHPVPTKDADEGGRRALALAREFTASDRVLVLVSGGGSSMLELPAPGVTLEELQRTTEALLRAGAPIEDLNAIRCRLSQLKGGRLAVAMAPAKVVNVVLSDVPGASPALVASGPTMAPVGPLLDPAEAATRLGVLDELPSSVRALLLGGPANTARAEVQSYLAADNTTAVEAVIAAGARMGLRLGARADVVAGCARDVGAELAREAASRCRREDLDGLVWGGETTVVVRGEGRGGRNQELVLGARRELAGGLIASFGTDGVDGTARAAGAYLDAAVLERAEHVGVTASSCLQDNDADRYFEGAGGRIVTGRTGTNVADVGFYLRGRSRVGSALR